VVRCKQWLVVDGMVILSFVNRCDFVAFFCEEIGWIVVGKSSRLNFLLIIIRRDHTKMIFKTFAEIGRI
jgi:hypothetical protein